MPRVYTRKFDWHEAKRLRGEGLTYRQIADRLGVSDTAVMRACDPWFRERMEKTTSAWVRGARCPDCGTQTTRQRKGEDHRCRRCDSIRRGTTARDGELLCTVCREWKPDDAYPHSREEKHARRGRHGSCRVCLTVARREYRNRHKVPCATGCGRQVMAPNEQRPGRPGVCRSCAARAYQARIRAERKTA